MATQNDKEKIIQAAREFALSFNLEELSREIDRILFGTGEKPVLPKFEPKKEFKLTESQKAAFEVAKNQSVLITGEAGTGKSYLLKALIDYFDQTGRNVSVTASTGVAAVNVSGSTIFSWAGIGIADKPAAALLKEVWKKKKAVDRILNCHVLIIDEISMLKGEVLDKLNYVFKAVRTNSKPFGGIQCIFVGDVLQIPCIPKAGVYDFCFQSAAWKEQNPTILQLKEIVRQENKEFTSFLSQLRVGKVSNLDLLKSRFNAKLEESGVKPINIFCKNVDVDLENKRELNKISGKVHVFDAIDTGDARHIESLDKNCLATRRIELKVGAQVMLLKNIDVENGLYNGSIGIVTKIDQVPFVSFNGREVIVDHEEWEIKEQQVTASGKLKNKTLAKRKQIPLKLAYAATVHKTQGQTLDKVKIDLTGAWEYGMHYVALSRVRTLEGLTLIPFDTSRIRANPDCLRFYGELKEEEVYDF